MDLAAQERWSQGQANLYLGIVAESSAEPQAASSYFRDVAGQRPYGDSALLPVALSISCSLIPRACEVRARCAEVTEALVRVVPNASAIASSMVNREPFLQSLVARSATPQPPSQPDDRPERLGAPGKPGDSPWSAWVEPGLSDVSARYAADHLFAEIDELGTRDGSNLVVEGYDFVPSFSIGPPSKSA